MKLIEQFGKLLDLLKKEGAITESTQSQLMTEATNILKEDASADIGETVKKAIGDALGQEIEKYKKTIEDLQKELAEAKNGKTKDKEKTDIPDDATAHDGDDADKKPKKKKNADEDGDDDDKGGEGDEKPEGDGDEDDGAGEDDDAGDGDGDGDEDEGDGDEKGEEDDEDVEMIPIAEALTEFSENWSEEALEVFNTLSETFNDEQEALIKQLLEMEMPKPCQAEKDEEGEDGDADKAGEEFAKAAGKNAAEIKSTLDDEGQATFEAISKKNLFSEAKGFGKLENLYKRKQKAEEALLNKQIRALGKQGRKFKMTGGVLGQTDRTNNFGNILKDFSRKLAMAESAAKKLEDENQTLSERVSDLVRDNDKMIVENRALKLEKTTLSEKVKTTSDGFVLSEAKAYLVEQSKGLTQPLREHLLREMAGRSVEYVKRNLNEAIEAFEQSESKRRSEILSKRQPVDRTGNNLVSEAKEEGTDEGSDEAVNAIVQMCGGFSTNLKQR